MFSKDISPRIPAIPAFISLLRSRSGARPWDVGSRSRPASREAAQETYAFINLKETNATQCWICTHYSYLIGAWKFTCINTLHLSEDYAQVKIAGEIPSSHQGSRLYEEWSSWKMNNHTPYIHSNQPCSTKFGSISDICNNKVCIFYNVVMWDTNMMSGLAKRCAVLSNGMDYY